MSMIVAFVLLALLGVHSENVTEVEAQANGFNMVMIKQTLDGIDSLKGQIMLSFVFHSLMHFA